MSCYISKTIDMQFADAVSRVTSALAAKGFGVLTSIDVSATMKNKLQPYTILGTGNPHLAWRALQAEDKIGTMLPCNVIVTELSPGRMEVAAMDPVASMAPVENPRLAEIAAGVRRLLDQVLLDL